MALVVDIKKNIGEFSLDVQLKIGADTKCLGISGTSGSGKSLTLKCIAGIEKPDEGRIVLDGRVLFDSSQKINLSPQQRNVGYLFQNYALFPTMTVEKNIEAGMKKIDRKQRQEIVGQWIRRFHLEGCEKKYPNQLSGGQQQRVALARMLAAEPEMIMLDEPFSALDTQLKVRLLKELTKLMGEFGGHVLLVSHDCDEIYHLSDELILMKAGKIFVSQKTRDFFADSEYVQQEMQMRLKI